MHPTLSERWCGQRWHCSAALSANAAAPPHLFPACQQPLHRCCIVADTVPNSGFDCTLQHVAQVVPTCHCSLSLQVHQGRHPVGGPGGARAGAGAAWLRWALCRRHSAFNAVPGMLRCQLAVCWIPLLAVGSTRRRKWWHSMMATKPCRTDTCPAAVCPSPTHLPSCPARRRRLTP